MEEPFVAQDWILVDDDGFRYRRRKTSLGSDATGRGEESFLTSHHLTVASQSALQRQKRMLLAAKARYTAELQAWEALFSAAELVTADTPAATTLATESVHMSPPSAVASDVFPELCARLLTEVEQLEDLQKFGKNLIPLLQLEVKTYAAESLVITTPFASARKVANLLQGPL